MSHFTRTRTRLVDGRALVEALVALGFDDVENHDDAVPLFGYRGDQRADKANIIVRRKHIGSASNDIGFVRTPSGEFTAIISEFDARRFGPNWLRQLSVEYARATVNQYAADNGWTREQGEVVEEDGTIRLVLRRTS